MRTGERVHGCFIYPRYSTDNQSAETIEVQIEKCTAYCHQNHIPILGVYPDYAISGMKASRPQYDRMIADLKAGMADTVVVYDQSRLFRDMVYWFQCRAELQAMGVQIISVTQPYVGGDLRDPSVYMQEATWGLFNQLHVLQTRQKTMAALRHMAQNGQHTGGKPALGYRSENGRLVLDEKEAPIVRRIFKEYYSGKSYREIVAGLNADGITTKLGNAWGNNSLNAILKNEKYKGTIVYGEKVYRPDGTRNTAKPEGKDVIRIDNGLPAIVTAELWEAVQARMHQNQKAQSGRPATARSYPLKGKVFCGICGSAMSVAASKNKKGIYYYYRCGKKDRNGSCDCPPIRADKLEELVVTWIRALMGNADIQQETLTLLKQEADKINQSGISAYMAMEDQQQKVTRQIERIIDAIAAGAYSQSMNARLQALEEEKANNEARLKSLRRAAEMASLPSKQLETLYKKVIAAAQNDTAAVCSVVSRVEVYPDHIIIYTAFDPDHTPQRWDAADAEAVTLDADFIDTVGTPSGVFVKQPRIERFRAVFLRLWNFRKSKETNARFQALSAQMPLPGGIGVGFIGIVSWGEYAVKRRFRPAASAPHVPEWWCRIPRPAPGRLSPRGYWRGLPGNGHHSPESWDSFPQHTAPAGGGWGTGGPP